MSIINKMSKKEALTALVKVAKLQEKLLKKLASSDIKGKSPLWNKLKDISIHHLGLERAKDFYEEIDDIVAGVGAPTSEERSKGFSDINKPEALDAIDDWHRKMKHLKHSSR